MIGLCLLACPGRQIKKLGAIVTDNLNSNAILFLKLDGFLKIRWGSGESHHSECGIILRGSIHIVMCDIDSKIF